ncbi:hypothetical protein MTR67_038451, partial [Solanum verrucosum]
CQSDEATNLSHRGGPVSIISDRGPQFTSSFWRTFQDELGTRVDLSTAFHLQTDGQSERMIQMAPFEALYGRRCRSPVGWFESTEPRLRGTDLMREALDYVRVIQDRLRIAQSRHQSYTGVDR